MSMKEKIAIPRERLIERPYEVFAECRSLGPVLWVDLFGEEGWLVTGYPEADALLKDPRFIREDRRTGANAGGPPPLAPWDKLNAVLEMKQLMFVFRDAPFHTRMRGLVSHAFTPAMLNQLRPMIEQIALDLIEARRGKREHELFHDFAHWLPILVIAGIVGVPREDSGLVRSWSKAFQALIDYEPDTVDFAPIVEELTEAQRYFRRLIAQRRTKPQLDLLSQLVAAEKTGGITEDEVVATSFLLFFAGHETTINAITNGYYLLLKHPDMYERLRQDVSLIPNAVEEMLRFEPPATITQRRAAVDMDFFGQSVRSGQSFIVAMGGANRDPRANADPDRFDVERASVKHLSFGAGSHFCLGAPLSRIEIPIAIEVLLRHLKQPRLLEEPVWRKHAALRGMHQLRVEAEVL